MTQQPKMFIILHNIRSAYNVGAIFRTADAVGADKIYLCGHTPIPLGNNAMSITNVTDKVAKTALGAEKTVPWEYHAQTWRLLEKLKNEGTQIVALEQDKKEINYLKFKPHFPLALVVGNEVKGLNKNILARADKIIAIPMRGKKESLNLSVACGIAVYKIMENTM